MYSNYLRTYKRIKHSTNDFQGVKGFCDAFLLESSLYTDNRKLGLGLTKAGIKVL